MAFRIVFPKSNSVLSRMSSKMAVTSKLKLEEHLSVSVRIDGSHTIKAVSRI